MGIHDRDYYRGSSPPSLTSGLTPSCQRILIATIVVFVLQLVTQGALRGSGVTSWLGLDTGAVLQGQIWRLLTYALCHDTTNPWHIIWNMLFFWWFGRGLEALYGSRQFLYFYVTAAVVAGVTDLILALILGQRHFTVGASGAVMAVCMLYALYYPTQKILVMFIIPVEIRWVVAFYVISNLWPVMESFGPRGAVSDGIAHAAHLGGLAYGFLYKYFDLRYRGNWDWNLPRLWRDYFRRRQFRVYQPEQKPQPPPPRTSSPQDDQELKRRVDEILAKISESGEASLTDAEREVLKDASRRYKNQHR